MRLLILQCLLMIFVTSLSGSDAFCEQPYDTEALSFLAKDDSTMLHGTLTLPYNFGERSKLAILVNPPQARSRDYGGLFSNLADTLAKNGIATFRFDNRAFSNKNLAEDATSMFDQIDDVMLAMKAIEADIRFKTIKIGLIGHSEGASIAAMIASQKRVAFSAFLATSGINGIDLAYTQMTNEIMQRFPAFPETDQAIMFDILYNEMKIITDHDNPDSVGFYMDQHIDHLYSTLPKAWFGEQTLEQARLSNRKRWLKPRLMAYIRFKPAAYYPNIKGPKLILCGTLDEKIDYAVNLQAFREMFNRRDHHDCQIIAVEGVNHNLCIVDSAENETGDGKNRKFSSNVWKIIVDWILEN